MSLAPLLFSLPESRLCLPSLGIEHPRVPLRSSVRDSRPSLLNQLVLRAPCPPLLPSAPPRRLSTSIDRQTRSFHLFHPCQRFRSFWKSRGFPRNFLRSVPLRQLDEQGIYVHCRRRRGSTWTTTRLLFVISSSLWFPQFSRAESSARL